MAGVSRAWRRNHRCKHPLAVVCFWWGGVAAVRAERESVWHAMVRFPVCVMADFFAGSACAVT